MGELVEKIKKYRESPYPTLIIGETGTGKELVTRALVPSGKNLIVVNCPRYEHSESLLESELFGHVKGSFTGATSDNHGLLAQAHGQVIFLDELHKLPMAAQAKLLRFLQEMRFRRVGDNGGRETQIDFKLIAATKPEIFKWIKDGQFMEDLFHRVGQLQIHVPSLRDRADDIEPLVRHFQNEFNKNKSTDKQKQVRISTVNEMMKHTWSGNVRELQNAVRQMLTDATAGIINPCDFESYLKRPGVSQVKGKSLDDALKNFEIEQIIAALKSCQTQVDAAIKLGMKPPTLNKKLERLGINSELFLMQA